MEQQLKDLAEEATRSIVDNDNLDTLEELRLKYVGRSGAITTILRGLSQLTGEERKQVGQLANEVKEAIQQAHDARKRALDDKALEARLLHEKIDVTLAGTRIELGHIHPLTQIWEEITSIFYGMGFSVAEGPEVETDYYNFDALNTPKDHPARDEQDTFYTNVRPDVLLRSQTSTVQVRVMEKTKPPLKVISPGRVYRNEEINARKYPLFHQVEGLLVDRDVTFGQLKGTLNAFIRLLFGKPLKTRFRPDFFPFTEPSAELDSQCPFCEGIGCRTCGGRGWLELLGCGMIDPNVLSGAGIDPEEWSGFAFGMGLERLAMLKFGINDIRHFYNNDLRFLKQF
ncbi:MAG: phenylalanine--tRNA ligase subunit alpha [Candidatus Obscuribacterales bacterium]|nr:phenylalanine--tRNA ligase subunit alpha [Candidatus Obscuribacterales bacterium]